MFFPKKIYMVLILQCFDFFILSNIRPYQRSLRNSQNKRHQNNCHITCFELIKVKRTKEKRTDIKPYSIKEILSDKLNFIFLIFFLFNIIV